MTVDGKCKIRLTGTVKIEYLGLKESVYNRATDLKFDRRMVHNNSPNIF